MPETAQQYTERLVGYLQGKDALRSQQQAPRKLAALLKGRKKQHLTRRPAPGKWSIAEIVAHMADAEIAISWRLRQILSTDGVALQAYDQDSWAAAFNYGRRAANDSLAQYTALRNANVELLKSVPRRAWDNHGMHAERGRETVTHMVRLAAGHDLNHLQQIERILRRSSD